MKENILNGIKLFLLLYAMVQGFFLTYSFIWFLVGLPLTNRAIAVCYILAGVSEYGYYRWLRE